MCNNAIMDSDGHDVGDGCYAACEESREDRLARENLRMASDIARLEALLARREAQLARLDVVYRRWIPAGATVLGPISSQPRLAAAWLSLGLLSGALPAATYVRLTEGDYSISPEKRREIYRGCVPADEAVRILIDGVEND